MSVIVISGLKTLHNAASDNNFNTPTNPFLDAALTADATNRVFGIIDSNGTDTTTIYEPVSSAGLITEYSTQQISDGFSIFTYNAEKGTGLNLASIDITVNDYFVLLHSDDANLHHIAKITSIEGADIDGDKIEFEPSLGNQINKDVKFMVFKGPAVSNTIHAISLGLKSTPHVEVVCSRPLWYFYDSKLNKSGELNHNTKYFAKMGVASSGSSINMSSPSAIAPFTVVDEYRNKVIDYSKFSYNITTGDNLKNRDDPDIKQFNEGSTAQNYLLHSDYDQYFINARRSATDSYADTQNLGASTGPYRYLRYGSSPSKSNLLPSVVSSFIQETVDGKSGYSESKIIDTSKIYGKKINLNDAYVVRQSIGRDSFHEWKEIAELEAFHSTRQYDVDFSNSGLPQQLAYYLREYDEVKIGNRICWVDGTVSATRIALTTYSRLDTDSTFATSFDLDTFTAGTKIYRRAFNCQDNSLLTDIDFVDNRTNKMKLILHSKAFKGVEVSLVAPPVGVTNKYKLLYLTFDANLRGYGTRQETTTGLQYAKGEYTLLYEVFNGRVEKINRTIENNIPSITIEGRSNFSKLIDPITNKDTEFSADIMYSSFSPYNPLAIIINGVTGVTGTILFNSKTIALSANYTFNKGTHLWTEWGYIGEVSVTSSGNSVVLVDYPKVMGVAGTKLWKETIQKDMYNKALSTNPYIDSSTDLNGASDKGIFFKDGVDLTGYTSALVESGSLAGTSGNSNPNSIGYDIDVISRIDSDSVFMANSVGRKTINTLMDFTIISVEEDNNNSIVKLAPYIPITLGRSQINYANTNDASFVYLGATINQDSTDLPNIACVIIDGPTNAQINLLLALDYNDPIYIGDTSGNVTQFVGRFLALKLPTSGDNYTVLIQQSIEISLVDNGIGIYGLASTNFGADKKQHDLHFINGAHLHGGKIVSLLGPNNTLYDYALYNDGNQKSYAETFGSSIFRLISVEKGNIGASFDFHSVGFNDHVNYEHGNNKSVYDNEPEGKYYATAYKHRTNPSDSSYYGVNRTGVYPNSVWPVEQRGIVPITGSNYFDRKLFPNTGTDGAGLNLLSNFKTVIPIEQIGSATNNTHLPTILSKSNFYQIDPTASRFFLFVNSDKYLYSSSRKDSLLNAVTTDIRKYGLLTMGKPTISNSSQQKESTSGGTSRLTYLDTSYKHNNIIECDKIDANSVSTLSTLTRFGLMRLTECVYDVMWNPINPENKQDTETVLQGNHKNFSHTVDSAGSINSWNAKVATFASTPNCIVGDLLVDRLKHQVIGRVTNISTNAVTIEDDAMTAFSSFTPIYKTGNIYKISGAGVLGSLNGQQVIGGYGSGSSYIAVTNSSPSINLSKGLVFQGSLGGFSADINSDWNKEYRSLIINTQNGYNAAFLSPLTFRDNNYATSSIITKINNQICTSNGTTSLTLGDSSVFQIGDYIEPNITLGVSALGNGAWNHIVGIPDSTHVTLNAAATTSAATLAYFTEHTCDYHNSNIITHDANSSIVVGLSVTGAYMPPNAIIASITDSTHFVLNREVITTGSANTNETLTFTNKGVFYSKKPVKTNYMNSIFKWLDSAPLTPNTTGANDMRKILVTVLQNNTTNNQSGFLTVGTTTTLSSLMWGHVLISKGIADDHSSYNSVLSYPLYATTPLYARFKGTGYNTAEMNFATLDGAVLGFKPSFIGNDVNTFGGNKITANANSLGPNNKTYYNYTINHNTAYKFLEFIDITGCYLVPEYGYREGSIQAASSGSCNGVTVADIICVVSHEYDTKTAMSAITTDNSKLILDKAFLTNVRYKIMQPNPVCFWPNSPSNFKLNELNSRYTKEASSDNMYSSMNDFQISSGSGNSDTVHSSEGISSMYVVVDVDNLGGNDNTVLKTIAEVNTAIGEIDKEVCISDGETTVITNLKTDNKVHLNKLFECKFGKISKKLNGVLSISEPFELKVNGKVKTTDTRAMIGSNVSIVKESEDLIEELLNESAVDYSLTASEYPIFSSPDFQGTSVFSMVNYLLNLKDKKLVDDAGTFKMASQSTKLTKFSFNDDDILEYTQTESGFDFYNEIVVYGSGIKAISKDMKNIELQGRKTLEVFDNKLTTQEDVDKHAFTLLKIHSNFTQNLELKLPVSKVKTLSAGDIVSCEIKQENITRNNYMVLEIIHDFSGIVSLKIGKYVKNLEDRFAELLLESGKTNSYLRKKEFIENENSFNFFDNLKIKEISLTIRKRIQSGTSLGFGEPLNTDGTTLGFGGSVSHTVLLQEDL